MDERFLRAEMLLGPEAMGRLGRSRVAVFGLGGVGSWCAEALCRSGVGALTLIDEDTVALSNINRQAEALTSTVGLPKADSLAARLRDIAPDCRITPVCRRYEADSREEFFAERPDYIADCIDLVSCKLDLIQTALARGIPIISALGTGNKTDAAQLRLADIAGTFGCPLARVMRRELRRRGIEHTDVVFSPQEAITPARPEAPPPGRRSVPGSLMWVPATAGMLMAQKIVLSLSGLSAR